MKILIMGSDKSSWYKNKIGKTYSIKNINNKFYITKEGPVVKQDAAVIEE